MPGNRHTQLCCLEGSTPEDGSGASHQAKDIVVAPGEPFCTANGSHFALWLSVCQRQTRRMGRFSQASLLAWMNITAWLQGRKPRESNKLFDLFLPKSESVLSVVEQKSRGREPLSPGEGYRCGSRGAFLYCQRQLFCFLGAWKVLHGRTGSCAIGLLPRRVLSRDL